MSECIVMAPISGERPINHVIGDHVMTATSCDNNNDSSTTPADVIEWRKISIEDDGRSSELGCDRQVEPTTNGSLPPVSVPDGNVSSSASSGNADGEQSCDGTVGGIHSRKGSESSYARSEREDSVGSLKDIRNSDRDDRQTAIVTLSRRMLARNSQLNKRRKSSIFLALVSCVYVGDGVHADVRTYVRTYVHKLTLVCITWTSLCPTRFHLFPYK